MTRDLVIGCGTEGYASGKAFVFQHDCANQNSSSKGIDVEKKRFSAAVSSSRKELEALAESNDIFAAHLEMIDDPMLEEQVASCIESGLSADVAVKEACKAISEMFELIDDEYLKARADDVRDICARITGSLSGKTVSFDSMPDESILVADYLLPSETAKIDFSKLRAIITEQGSITSHVCIIARGNRIPAIVGAKGVLNLAEDGIQMLVLAKEGQIVIRPDADDLHRFNASKASFDKALEECEESAHEKALTMSGKEIPVYANAGSVEEVKKAIECGADGIGLFRTEFLFMQSEQHPDEETQFQAYSQAARICNGKPLTIRTLDIGGDKSLPYMNLQKEENPFLGVRAIRLCMANKDMFMTQLRAIMRASVHGNIKVMFPMICTVDELRECMAMLEEARMQTGAARIPAGIMVETPASVLMAEELSAECDFMSIGSNDLTQYILAADRGNVNVAHIYNQQSPAVMKAIRMTALNSTVPVGICGELASDPEASEPLIMSGLSYLSTSTGSISTIKNRIRKIQ